MTDDILRRGKRAEELLANETLQAALNALRKDKIALLMGRGPIEDIEAARHGLWAVEDVTAQLQSFVDDAKMLAHKLGKTAPR